MVGSITSFAKKRIKATPEHAAVLLRWQSKFAACRSVLNWCNQTNEGGPNKQHSYIYWPGASPPPLLGAGSKALLVRPISKPCTQPIITSCRARRWLPTQQLALSLQRPQTPGKSRPVQRKSVNTTARALTSALRRTGSSIQVTSDFRKKKNWAALGSPAKNLTFDGLNGEIQPLNQLKS